MHPRFLLPVLCLFALPPALAQQHDDGAAAHAAATDARGDASAAGLDAAAGDAHADAETTQGPRSGFGQVMSVLTGLLQDAAQREATGRDDGFALDNPAIDISVTPVAGQSSLLRAPVERRPGSRTARERQLAGGTP